jgi:hypothetical protein
MPRPKLYRSCSNCSEPIRRPSVWPVLCRACWDMSRQRIADAAPGGLSPFAMSPSLFYSDDGQTLKPEEPAR